MMHKAWSTIDEVLFCFARSSVKFQGHTALKIVEFDPDWAFPDCNSSLNTLMAVKWCIKLEATSKRCPIVFQGHPSNFKVTQHNKSPILTRIEYFWTVTLVWIHRWLWNDAQSLKQHRRGALLFLRSSNFKVTRDIASPIFTQIERFRTVTPLWIHRGVWDDAQSLM